MKAKRIETEYPPLVPTPEPAPLGLRHLARVNLVPWREAVKPSGTKYLQSGYRVVATQRDETEVVLGTYETEAEATAKVVEYNDQTVPDWRMLRRYTNPPARDDY